jgi:hypothetical protein
MGFLLFKDKLNDSLANSAFWLLPFGNMGIGI